MDDRLVPPGPWSVLDRRVRDLEAQHADPGSHTEELPDNRASLLAEVERLNAALIEQGSELSACAPIWTRGPSISTSGKRLWGGRTDAGLAS